MKPVVTRALELAAALVLASLHGCSKDSPCDVFNFKDGRLQGDYARRVQVMPIYAHSGEMRILHDDGTEEPFVPQVQVGQVPVRGLNGVLCRPRRFFRWVDGWEEIPLPYPDDEEKRCRPANACTPRVRLTEPFWTFRFCKPWQDADSCDANVEFRSRDGEQWQRRTGAGNWESVD